MGSVGSGAHNYLRFEKLPLEKGQKLHKYKVTNHSLFQDIGIIRWRGGWRQYVFTARTHNKENIVNIDGGRYLPIEHILDIDMSRGCHKKIDEFIDKLMEEWKKSKEVKPNS